MLKCVINSFKSEMLIIIELKLIKLTYFSKNNMKIIELTLSKQKKT